MAPSKRGPTFAFASAGAIQLLVGPASCFSRLAMKVRCSVRATSVGWLRCRVDPGAFPSWRRRRVPSASIPSVIREFSEADPSHHATRAGLTSDSTSATHFSAGVIVLPTVRYAEKSWRIEEKILGADRAGGQSPNLVDGDSIGRPMGRRVAPKL